MEKEKRADRGRKEKDEDGEQQDKRKMKDTTNTARSILLKAKAGCEKVSARIRDCDCVASPMAVASSSWC